MAKTMKEFTLTGVVPTDNNNNAIPAKAHQADSVIAFVNDDKKFVITKLKGAKDSIYLETPKGEYTLTKHPSCNYYQGTLNGTKVQVSLKKIIGTLRAWY